MSYVITSACVDVMDRSCVDQCPVDCIVEGRRMLYIDPDICIDCGACEPVCPQDAVMMDDGSEGELEVYRIVNAEFFSRAELGPADAPGQTEAVDHPIVAGLDPRPEP